MKISFYEKIQLATHINRKVSSLNIGNKKIEEAVYEDIEREFKREFGLNRRHPDLDDRFLYEAHDVIDSYDPPLYLEELIKEANVRIELDVSA